MWQQIDTTTGEIKTIYGPKEIVEHLSDTLNYYAQEVTTARALANKTREEVAAEIQNQYAAENAYLHEKLRFSFGFFSSEKELQRWHEFIKRHEDCRLKTKIDGGKMPYIIPYETGIGQGVIAVCQACGEKEDITDNSVW